MKRLFKYSSFSDDQKSRYINEIVYPMNGNPCKEYMKNNSIEDLVDLEHCGF